MDTKFTKEQVQTHDPFVLFLVSLVFLVVDTFFRPAASG
jgi:hypothetical protein